MGNRFMSSKIIGTHHWTQSALGHYLLEWEQQRCDEAVAAAIRRFGDLHILHNNVGISVRGRIDELTDDEIHAVIQKAVKQRRESIEQYKKAGREDLVEKEQRELEILEAYLPKPLTQEELEAIVEEAIKEVQATSLKDMGKVMKVVMPKVRGRADGRVVNELVKSKLGG